MPNSVDWGDYKEFTVITATRPEDDTREGARAQFDNWRIQKSERNKELAELLQRNGLSSGGTDAEIQSINDWYIASVASLSPPIPDAPGMLEARWYPVIVDLAIYLGDIISERYPGLQWKFFTPTNSDLFGYQKPVIFGFTHCSGKVDEDLVFDLASSIAMVGHKIAMGKPLSDRNRGDFLRTLELAALYR